MHSRINFFFENVYHCFPFLPIKAEMTISLVSATAEKILVSSRENLTSGIPARSCSNQAAQLQRLGRIFHFCMEHVLLLYFSDSLGADQTADVSMQQNQVFSCRGATAVKILVATCDFQQCGILTSVDSDNLLQPPTKLRNSK